MEKKTIKIGLRSGILIALLMIIILITIIYFVFFRIENTNNPVVKLDTWEYDEKKHQMKDLEIIRVIQEVLVHLHFRVKLQWIVVFRLKT